MIPATIRAELLEALARKFFGDADPEAEIVTWPESSNGAKRLAYGMAEAALQVIESRLEQVYYHKTESPGVFVNIPTDLYRWKEEAK